MLQRDYDKLRKQSYGKKKGGDVQESETPYHVSTHRDGHQITTTTAIKAGNNHVYLNVIVQHNRLIPTVFHQPSGGVINYLSNTAPQVTAYDTTKTTPILNKSSDYKCSVIRFTIPLDEVPLMIMPVIPNLFTPPPVVPPALDYPASSNLTPFFVGISYLGVNYYSQLVYVPENPYPAPKQDQPFQVITPYYYVFDYITLISMINTALSAAWDLSPLPTLAGTISPAPVIPLVAPYIFLDPTTSLISLVVPYIFGQLVNPPFTEIPVIYVNTLLQTYIDSFPFKGIANDDPEGHDFEFILFSSGITDQNIYYPPFYGLSPGNNRFSFYRIIQEYPTLQYWSSIRKIIITTAGIPINAEAVPASFGNGDVNVSFPIISDYVPEIEGRTGESRTIAYYLPSAQYRYVDLLSDLPLQKVDLRFFWQDRVGNLYPIEISSYQQIEVKIVFVKKDINTEKSA